MIKQLIMLILFSFCYMQGTFGGYAIFDYSNDSGKDGFDLKRAYLSYSTDISEDLFFKIRLDANRPLHNKLYVFVKNAYVDLKFDNGDKLSMGLIGTNSYGVQEKNWGYRFIEKSVIDKYGMTNTADYGISYSKNFGKIKSSIQLLNGEGYGSEETDNNQAIYLSFLYGEPELNKNDGMNFGIVVNHVPKDIEDNSLIGFFGGWSFNNLRFGLEHNQYKEKGISYIKKVSSLYTNYSINEKWAFVLRHDINKEKFGEYLPENSGEYPSEFTIVGGVWNPTKGLYLSPNVYLQDNTNTYRITCMFKY